MVLCTIYGSDLPGVYKGEDGKDVLDADGNRQLDYGDGSVQRPQYSDFNP